MRQPTRRSRKIGLTQGGRIEDGRSSEKRSRIFTWDIWDRLSMRQADGALVVLRENPSKAYFHPCRGSEYLAVLERLPPELRQGLNAIVLRRTPSLDAQLGIEARKRFLCVILNAFPRSMRISWNEGAGAATRRHYGRWCAGDWVARERALDLQWSLEEVRRYYLFHLFLHELGHIHQPWSYSARRREAFAENFALEWADRIGELPPAVRE